MLDSVINLLPEMFGGKLSDMLGDFITFSPTGRILTFGKGVFGIEPDSTVATQIVAPQANTVDRATLSRDGQQIFSWKFSENKYRLIQVDSGRILLEGVAPSPIKSAAFSSRGDRVAIGIERGVVMLDIQTAKQVNASMDVAAPIRVEWTGDSEALITRKSCPLFTNPLGCIDQVQLWNISDGRELAFAEGNFAIDREGKIALVAGEGKVARWNLKTGEVECKFEDDTMNDRVALAADGRFALIGATDGTARLWDLARWTQIAILPGHAGPIQAVGFSPDGSLAFTAGTDSVVRLWSIPIGQPLVSLVSRDDGGWYTIAPNGRFDTDSFDEDSPLHWIADDDQSHALPVEVFTWNYYTPRLLPTILRNGIVPSLPSIDQINRAQPEIEILSITQRSRSLVDVVVEVRGTTYLGQQSGARDLRLFRDGSLVAHRKGPITLDRRGRAQIEFRNVKTATTDGAQAEFSAYAFNVDHVRSRFAHKSLELSSVPSNGKKSAYVIAIGVNEIQDLAAFRLRFAANDATGIRAAVQDALERTGDYDRVETWLLTSDSAHPKGATKDLIRKRLKELADRVEPSDLVVISFAGHGITTEDGTFHLLPSDASTTGGGRWRGTISSEELSDWLGPIDAREIALILDTCYAAASVEGMEFREGPLGQPGFGQIAFDKRMRILAAAQSAQTALESDRVEKGFLSYVLESGLRDGAADWMPKDGKIRLGEWLKYGAQDLPLVIKQIAADTSRGVVVNRQSTDLGLQSPLCSISGKVPRTASSFANCDKQIARKSVGMLPTRTGVNRLVVERDISSGLFVNSFSVLWFGGVVRLPITLGLGE